MEHYTKYNPDMVKIKKKAAINKLDEASNYINKSKRRILKIKLDKIETLKQSLDKPQYTMVDFIEMKTINDSLLSFFKTRGEIGDIWAEYLVAYLDYKLTMMPLYK